MATFDLMAQFDSLLPVFAQHRANAQGPDGEPPDEPFARIARAGFLLHGPLDQWYPEMEDGIRGYRRGFYSDAALSRYGDDSLVMASFAFLALGYLWGLYSQGEIGSVFHAQGVALLPDYMAKKAQDIISAA